MLKTLRMSNQSPLYKAWGRKKDIYAHSGPPFSLYAPLSFFFSLSCFCVLAPAPGLVYSSGPLPIGNHSASSDGKSESSGSGKGLEFSFFPFRFRRRNRCLIKTAKFLDIKS